MIERPVESGWGGHAVVCVDSAGGDRGGSGKPAQCDSVHRPEDPGLDDLGFVSQSARCLFDGASIAGLGKHPETRSCKGCFGTMATKNCLKIGIHSRMSLRRADSRCWVASGTCELRSRCTIPQIN
jgi:hypothetical protein